MGDALIKSAAEVLCQTVGDAGTVARLGGDEFVILINEFVHRQEVALLAERITRTLNRTDLVPTIDTQVSASIGVALFPEHGRDMSTLLKNADAAMYQAKRDGRNQFSFFNPIRYERAAREVQLGIELVKAVQGDAPQFICEYQPQVEMVSGRVVGLEALIRWQHPVHGVDARSLHRCRGAERSVGADHALGAERRVFADQSLASGTSRFRCRCRSTSPDVKWVRARYLLGAGCACPACDRAGVDRA